MKFGVSQYLDTDNIGDDIITYATSRFLDKCDFVVDRENFSGFKNGFGEKAAALMTGWYAHSDDPEKLTFKEKNLEKIFFGVHFKSEKTCEPIMKYCRDNGLQIGCRDASTLEMCRKNGVDSYLSYCPTLALDNFSEKKTKNIICCVDLPESAVRLVRETYPQYVVEDFSHQYRKGSFRGMTFERRMELVRILLSRYNDAKCVVTTRLHAALPSIAMNVPVVYYKAGIAYRNGGLIFSRDGRSDRRFSDYIGKFAKTVDGDGGLRGIDFENLKNNADDLISAAKINKRRILERLQSFAS